jgi:two-component system, cell cycle sensor histidine kinase and response regulator CckA
MIRTASDGPADRRPDPSPIADAIAGWLGKAIYEAPVGIVVVDRVTGLIQHANAAACELVGYAASELVALPVTDLIHPDDRRRAVQARAPGADGTPGYGQLDLDLKLVRRDGSVVWARVLSEPVMSSPGGLDVGVVMVVDVTDRRQAEEALRAREARYRGLLEALPDGVMRLGIDGVVREQKQPRDWPTYLSDEEQAGRSLSDLVPPGIAARIHAAAIEAIEGGMTTTVEVEVPFPDGSSRWYDTKIARCGPDEAVSIARDITDRRRSERELQRLERYSRALAQNALEIVVVTDANAMVREVVGSLESTLGYAPDDVIGTLALTYFHPSELPQSSRSFADLLGGRGRSVSWEGRLRHRDGTWRWVSATAVNLLDDPDVRGLVANFRDISAHKALEEQFLQAQKMEALGRLAGGIAHDVNNILTVINGYADLVRLSAEPGSELADAVGEILAAGGRAASLIDRLLESSRRRPIEPVVIDVAAQLTEILGLLRRVITPNVTLDVSFPGDLGRIKVDAGHLEQILLNLVTNACDAMPDGGPLTITASAVQVAPFGRSRQGHVAVEPGRYVMIDAVDAGVGMHPAVAARIFEPFFTTKTRGRGTGLGLSTVYGIVHQNRGTIRVLTEPGSGTTMRVYLPLVDDASPEPGPSPDPGRSESGGGHETVLVVEDDDEVRTLAVLALEHHGYRVVAASDAIEAMRVLEAGEPKVDAVLADLMLPGPTGLRLADLLEAQRPELAVVLMSGYGDDADPTSQWLGLRRGHGRRFVSKPFGVQQLATAIRSALDAPGSDL